MQSAMQNGRRWQTMPARILLRIHANGSEYPEASGALALVPSAENTYVGNLSEQSTNLAQTILQSYCDATGIENLGVQYNDTMTGINWSAQPEDAAEKNVDSAVNTVDIIPPVEAIPSEKEIAQLSQDKELTALLRSLADDAAQTGGVWAVAVQRANDETASRCSASLIKLFVAATVEENSDSVAAWEQYSGETADLLFHMISESGNEAPHTLVNRLGNGNAEAGMALVNAYCTKYGYQDTSRQADRKKGIIAVVAAVVGIALVGWLLFGERGYKATVEKFFEACMDGDVQGVFKLIPNDVIKSTVELQGYDKEDMQNFVNQTENELKGMLALGGVITGDMDLDVDITGDNDITGEQLKTLQTEYKDEYNVKVKKAKIVYVNGSLNSSNFSRGQDLEIL